jgi:uncharacterized membrane protein
MSQIPRKQRTQEDSNDVDPINENIQTIVELHKHAENETSKQQRTIEDITDWLGRPAFLFIILAFASLWIIINVLLIKFGISSFDPPPFIWLQGILSLGALLQATMILITQNREDIMTERRTQLDLQVSLIIDQKMSKLLSIVDQLRQVHPDLDSDTDPEVEALKKTVDPHESVEALNQSFEEADRSQATRSK